MKEIPVLYHTFDATGLSMHFSTVGYFIVTIIIGNILLLLGMIPYFVSYISKKPDMGFMKWIDKSWEKFTLKKLFFAIFASFVVLTPFFSAGISKLFVSETEGKLFLEPNIFYKEGTPSFDFTSFYEKQGYDDKNSLVNKYSNEFEKAIKNNSQLNQYHIPECELNNAQSILCGGDRIDGVVANKGDKTFILQPHFSTNEKDARLILDNPKDKGVKVYFWVEEKEDKRGK